MNDTPPNLQGQIDALREALSGLNRQINDLRKAVEAIDQRQDKAMMNQRLHTNKLTTHDNRLAEQNNWLAAHATALQGLQTWRKDHTEAQDAEFAQVGEVIAQVNDLWRRTKALEDIAVKHDMRIDDVAETQHRRFDMHSGRIIELEDWQKQRDAEIPAAVGLERQLGQLRERVNELEERKGWYTAENPGCRAIMDQLGQLHEHLTDVEKVYGRRLDLHAERQAKANAYAATTDRRVADLDNKVEAIDRELTALWCANAGRLDEIADLIVGVDRQDESLTEVEARVADLEDAVFEEKAEEPTPNVAPKYEGRSVKIEWAEAETPIATGAKITVHPYGTQLYGSQIESWLMDAYRDASQELTRSLYLDPATISWTFSAPTADAKPRCKHCCWTCRAAGKTTCCNCDQPYGPTKE